jgi:cytosine deaminase
MTLVLPEDGSMLLRNARVHRSHLVAPQGPADADGFHRVTIDIRAGRVHAVRRCDPAAIGGGIEDGGSENGAIDLAGRVVFPAFVDCHTHLDKGHIWPRRPNPDGSFAQALSSVAADTLAHWSADDVYARMTFALRSAYAHGTKAIRTHIDSQPPQAAISWPVFEAVRAEWAGRIELQGVSLVAIELVRDRAAFAALARRVADAGGTLGAVAYRVEDLEILLDTVFRTALDLGLALDFHADETGDPRADSLRKIAEATLRHDFAGRITVGHCCSIATQHEDDAASTLELVRQAGLSVVTLPMCNLYLQDRRSDRTTPRWRGVTLVHEMAARGIPVAIASDNTRDPFYAYGDLDMLEVYRMGTRILHLDHPVGAWPAAVAGVPARMMGLDDAGFIGPRCAADLVIFKGRSFGEVMSRPESERVVIRDGRPIERTLPDYSELDGLMET